MRFRYIMTSKYILLLLSAHMFYCCILYFYSILVSSEIESVSVWSESFRSRLFCTIIQLTHVARNNVIDALTSYVGIASQAWIHSDKDKVFTFLKTCPLSIIPYMECSRSHWREESFPRNQHTTNTMIPRWWIKKQQQKTCNNSKKHMRWLCLISFHLSLSD